MFKDLIVELYLTEDCNMRCRYCYVNKGKRKMNWEIAKQSIDFISSLQYDSVIVCFFGGEPLIEWGLLKKTVEYAKSKKIDRFNVCTNAILLNKGILTYFKKNNIIPMLSIDGGKLAHNEQRVLINNKGSHGIIEKRLKLISKHLKNFKIQVQITVTNKTVKFLEDSVRYLLDAGITLDINIVPVFSKISKYHWDIKSLRLFKKNIYSIAELFLKKYKSGKEFKITNMCCVPGRDLISLAKNNNHSLYFCGLSERHLSISSEGKVYPCFMLSGSKENKPFILGDIWEGMRIPAIFKKKLDYLKSKTSNVISCPANNYFVNGDILRPVSAYSKISKFWIQASKYVNANL